MDYSKYCLHGTLELNFVSVHKRHNLGQILGLVDSRLEAFFQEMALMVAFYYLFYGYRYKFRKRPVSQVHSIVIRPAFGSTYFKFFIYM